MYFAVAKNVEILDKPTINAALSRPRAPPLHGPESPVVWILDPGSLNLWSVGEDGVYAPPNDDIACYLWDEIHDAAPGTAARPIALLPPRQNPRIVAQQGTFTLHGRDTVAIDEIAEKLDPSGLIHLACIVLDAANLAFIWDELRLAGVARPSIFPELDSVAEHIKWAYQGP